MLWYVEYLGRVVRDMRSEIFDIKGFFVGGGRGAASLKMVVSNRKFDLIYISELNFLMITGLFAEHQMC